MLVDDELREMIIENKSIVEIREKARKKGMKVLFEDGLEKALQGVTTLDEVSRVCEEIIEMKKKEIPSKEAELYVSGEKKDKQKKEDTATSTEDVEGYTKQIEDWISRKKKGKGA